MSQFVAKGSLVLMSCFLLGSCGVSTNSAQSHVTFFEVACGTPGSFRATIVPMSTGAASESRSPSTALTPQTSDKPEGAPVAPRASSESSNQPCLIAGLSRPPSFYPHQSPYGYSRNSFHRYSGFDWPYSGYGFSSVGWGHTAGHGFGHHRGH